MLDRIAAGVALGLLEWVGKRIERGSTATDAVADPARLERMRARIDAWVQSHGVRPGGDADAGGTGGADASVPDGRR